MLLSCLIIGCKRFAEGRGARPGPPSIFSASAPQDDVKSLSESEAIVLSTSVMMASRCFSNRFSSGDDTWRWMVRLICRSSGISGMAGDDVENNSEKHSERTSLLLDDGDRPTNSSIKPYGNARDVRSGTSHLAFPMEAP